jgi:hypothetical protein
MAQKNEKQNVPLFQFACQSGVCFGHAALILIGLWNGSNNFNLFVGCGVVEGDAVIECSKLYIVAVLW